MAYSTGDRLTIHCSFNAAVSVDESDGGNDYSTFMQDANVGTNGGTYTITYEPGKCMKWEGIWDVASQAAGTINTDANWRSPAGVADTPTKSGTVPTTGNTQMLFVRFVKAIGTPGNIKFYNNTTSDLVGILGPGEGLLIPCNEFADFTLQIVTAADPDVAGVAYEAGVTEAHLVCVAIGSA